MPKKQNLKVQQGVPAPSTALRVTEALEQQVRAHPVVQEAMRLFDARIVAVSSRATRETPRHLMLVRGVPSQEANNVTLTEEAVLREESSF